MTSRIALAFVSAVAALAVCVSCAPSEGGKSSDASNLVRVRVSGSGTCLPLLQILTDEYTEDRVSFVYLPGLHSGGGIKGVAQGDLEIGAVSRELEEKEQALGLKYHVLSNDGLAVAVHPSVAITGLTSEQVKEIYGGRYSNWSQLGGPDLPIVVLDRNEDESAKIILRKYVLGSDLRITNKAVKLYYESDMVDGVVSQPGSIGYFSLGYALAKKVRAKLVRLDDVEPTVENVENGSYRVVRPLGIVTDPDADTETARRVQEFVDWASGPEAARVFRARGFAAATSKK